MTLSALGIVFGDIGTSPLYALRECFHGPHAIAPTATSVLGVLSLITWSLILILTIKYLLFVMRADNKGEGGILALMALASSHDKSQNTPDGKPRLKWVIVFGLFGAALLYGDGVITPAISVLSAVEGLKVATPFFDDYILPITIVILIGLFLLQSNGTARIGRVFGPVILAWFTCLGLLGIKGIIEHPSVLAAVNPYYAWNFFAENSWHGFVVLGSVFLVLTGGEALYADLGHFGRRPIQLGWFCVAMPGLVLQYYGQGALLLVRPEAAENPFYLQAPGWALYPLVGLATAATIIASQALVTGAFSLSQQAAQLGYLPRINIKHTSAHAIGQIYVPTINWALMIGTIFLVLEFRSSSRLAAAYGIAVSSAMVITTALMYVVMRRRWGWKWYVALPITVFFIAAELCFFIANSLKFLDGGWFPIVLGVAVFMVMTTWKSGREILAARLVAISTPLDRFIKETVPLVRMRIPGCAVFMSAVPNGTPSALVHNVKHNQVLHQTIIILTVVVEEAAHVPLDSRVRVQALGEGMYRVTARFGFMETPNVPEVLSVCGGLGLNVVLGEVTFFLGRESLVITRRPGMALWREKLFAFMSRNAQRATDYFQIPPEQTIEIGAVVEM